MVNDIDGAGQRRMDRLARSRDSGSPEAVKKRQGPSDGEDSEVVVSSELRELVERIKGAETFRKARVHDVLEKLKRGELVISETVREAAERLLQEGI